MVKWLVVLVIVICCGFVVYPWFDTTEQGYQETNAYVVGRVVNLTANRAGRIVEISVQKGQRVNKGDVLMRLGDALIRYQIGQLQEQIKGYLLEEVEFCWDEKMAQKDILRSKHQREYLIARKQRLTELEQHKALAVEDIRALDNQISQAQVEALRLKDVYQKARYKNRLPLMQRPRITAALMRLKQNYYQLSLSNIVAPFDGFIYELTAYPGEQITTNDRLAVFIPDEELMVEANVLETYIHYFEPNKPVTVYSDVMGRDHAISGVVDSIVPTVSADLSMLPRNNQDSNWIKVSQRIPVLIKLDSSSLNGARLPMGTSVKVSVDGQKLDVVAASYKGSSRSGEQVRQSQIETASVLYNSNNMYQQALTEIFADFKASDEARADGRCL